ncbi:hypothetical protein DL96DRAFT_1646288 [Flagelloscypha sp. PMI_526]|nr:hypothetical protein DL96DRAFT_1646288 [Flagelloscypha sp. PMI_526]
MTRMRLSEKHVQSGYHLTRSSLTSTVVDERLKVKGVNQSRAVNTSVFPRCVATHPIAATILLAERCSE